MHNVQRKLGSAVALALLSANLCAAPREGARNDAALMKLQTALKTATAERDAARADFARLNGEVEQLRKDNAAALAAKDQLGLALAAQKQASQELHGRLENTHAKLSEASEKSRELSQAKAGLSQELAAVSAQKLASEQQLKLCGQHNAKLLDSARELLERYETKGTVASLLQDEPLLQFQSVEMEDIAQRYRDRIESGRFEDKGNSAEAAK